MLFRSYNESKATGGGSAILPTPAIGGIGLLKDWSKAVGIGFKAEGETIWLLGGHASALGQSIWLREVCGQEAGSPPSVDLEQERAAGNLVRQLVLEGIATAVHDISDGGLIVAIAEMGLAGGLGVDLDPLDTVQAFGEDQGRYLITAAPGATVPNAIAIGKTGGTQVFGVSLADLRTAHEGFFPKLMG